MAAQPKQPAFSIASHRSFDSGYGHAVRAAQCSYPWATQRDRAQRERDHEYRERGKPEGD